MFQSSKLNTNLSPFLSWKGKTFGQITSSIQKNGNSTTPEQDNYDMRIQRIISGIERKEKENKERLVA